MRLEFSAGGLIFRKGKDGKYEFALILDPFGKWTLPKGKIEKGEKPQIAALREISEEIGIKNLKIVANLGKAEYWFKESWKNKKELVHKFVYFYLIQTPQEGILKPQIKEIKDARWFSKDEILNLKTYKDTLPILKKALKILK